MVRVLDGGTGIIGVELENEFAGPAVDAVLVAAQEGDYELRELPTDTPYERLVPYYDLADEFGLGVTEDD